MAQTALLSDENFGLTEAEQIALTGMTQHPGYAVLEKLFMEACKRANDAVIALDPTEEGFERKFKPLQAKARERNEFSLLVLNSIQWHQKVVEDTLESQKKKDEVLQNPILKKGGMKNG